MSTAAFLMICCIAITVPFIVIGYVYGLQCVLLAHIAKRKYPERYEWLRGMRLFGDEIRGGLRVNCLRVAEYAVSSLEDHDPEVRVRKAACTLWSHRAHLSLRLLAFSWIALGVAMGVLQAAGILKDAGLLFLCPLVGGGAFAVLYYKPDLLYRLNTAK